MKTGTEKIFEFLFTEHEYLLQCRDSIYLAFHMIKRCYENNGKLLICGNGGSASDAEHIVGELMKGFKLRRQIPREDEHRIAKTIQVDSGYISSKLQRALPAISLASHISLCTAIINDTAPDMVYAQQVYGYGKRNDVVVGISTSGNTANVANAIKTARAFGIKSICLTGIKKCVMDELCDVVIKVPSEKTYRIQEMHAGAYHALCAALEEEFFGEAN